MPTVRTKIKTDDVMPEALELLKKLRRVHRSEVTEAAKAVAERRNLLFRPQAAGWSLTFLKRLGWADNPERGFWTITAEGEQQTLTPERVRALWPTLAAE